MTSASNGKSLTKGIRGWKGWLALFIAASAGWAAAQDATPAQVDWIRKNAIAFKTAAPGDGFCEGCSRRKLVPASASAGGDTFRDRRPTRQERDRDGSGDGEADEKHEA